MSTDRLHHPIVADAVDRLTAARTDSDVAPPFPPLNELMSACSAAAAAVELGERWRWQLHPAARLVTAYLQRLAPPAGWQRISPLDGTPLVWRCGDETFADVLVVRTRGAVVWTRHSSGLPRRLVTAGRDAFGGDFVGVRMCVLAAPARSLMVAEPSGTPSPLTTTPYWFHTTPRDPVELAAGAAGTKERP